MSLHDLKLHVLQVMTPVVIFLLLTSSQFISCCSSDYECSYGFEFCSMKTRTCILLPRELGDECNNGKDCSSFDAWADCINDTCACSPPYVERTGSCFSDNTPMGAAAALIILVYTLIPVVILIAIVVLIFKTVRGRSNSVPSLNEDASVSYSRRGSRRRPSNSLSRVSSVTSRKQTLSSVQTEK